MIRTLAGASALATVVTALLLPGAQAASERTLPMRFELRQQAGGCTDTCRTWIAAYGAITADSARDFTKFAEGRDLKGATIALDSDGGSVLGAIALGREIRRMQLATTVGRVVETNGADNTKRVAFSGRADCGSMCVFVLLGGTERSVPAGARVMVHQIWLGDRRDDPTAANYSAEDLVLVQRDIGRLAQYTVEMGGSIDLLDMALRIPPWEPMHSMSRKELALAKLDVTPAEPSAIVADAAPLAKVSVLPGNPIIGATPINDRRWAMVDGGNGAVLARRHPLTIEGDDIGTFDLTLACGDNGYTVNYTETRRPAAQWALPLALKSVTLRVGSQSAALKISSSQRKSLDELATAASAVVPASLIDAFAASGHHAVLIETNSSETITAIRVGNTGVTQNLPQLAARCGKSTATRADLASMKKTGGQAAAQ